MFIAGCAIQRRGGAIHAFLLRVPLIGKVVRGTNTARFARTFATLTSSAVPVLEALRISGEVVTNLPMRDAVQDAAARVREGAPIGRSLGASKHVSADDDSPDRERRDQRRPRDHARSRRHAIRSARWTPSWAPSSGCSGPLMILVMGGLVLLIVLAMLLPIFQLNQLIA